MLNHYNVQVRQATNGKEAVEEILRSRNATGNLEAPHYGMVLMDLSMPVMGGCEAIRILRQEKKIQDLPMIALTANAIEESQDDALTAGATEFATKPILRKDLYEKCQKYLRCTSGLSRHHHYDASSDDLPDEDDFIVWSKVK